MISKILTVGRGGLGYRKALAIFGSVLMLASTVSAQTDDLTPQMLGNARRSQRQTESSTTSVSGPCDISDVEAGNKPDCAGSENSHSHQPRWQDAHSSGSQITAPSTEFQNFVKAAVGQDLPIYGASLFGEVPSTFAPLDHIPVSTDYTIGPGDEIDLRVWGQINADEKLVVDRTGDVFMPQVGRMSVSGLHFVDLAPAIRTNIGRVFRNFELSVNMGQLRSIQIFVMGQARRPGAYTVSSLSTLVNALFVSGGPSPQGSLRKIELKRGGLIVSTFDLYDLLLHGDKSRDAALQPGDVLFIPPAGARVAVSGSVENAAIYEILPNTSLQQVLGFAGGLSPVAAGQHAVLERIDKRATLDSRNIELNPQGLETALQNGDIVTLLQVVPQLSKTVTLKGNVADPVRLPWHAGMKISDVIPDKRALLTRNYWNEHNRLSSGSGDYHDESRDDATDVSLARAITGTKQAVERKFETKNEIQPLAPNINWKYATIERLDTQSLTTKLINFDLGRVVIEHDAARDLTLEPGDIITIFSAVDFISPKAEQSRYVRLEGEVKMAGTYSVEPGETLRQLLRRAGGLTNQAYLFGAEFTRESTKREQQKRFQDYLDQMEHDLDQSIATQRAHALNANQESSSAASLEIQRNDIERLRKTPATGRIVLDLTPESASMDALPDLPLENGDRLIVPSIPATVNVFGTVYNQSTLVFKQDMRVRDYLQEVGGPTRYADEAHMFVIRANGSVVSGIRRSKLEALPMYAGDSLMVPVNAAKTSTLRNLLDFSQVISGFGIGAAAVNVLK